MVKRSELVRRIRDLIVVVKDYEQRAMLEAIQITTIPYYLVGLDEQMEHSVRSFLAECAFVATFELGYDQDAAIGGPRVAALAQVPKRLQDWIDTAHQFSKGEREFIYDWCNPMQFLRNEKAVLTLSAWGCGVYQDGRWQVGMLTPNWLKAAIGFDDEQHMLAYDIN